MPQEGRPMREQVAAIVAAYVGHNTTPHDQLPALIESVGKALGSLGRQMPVTAAAAPAVPIRRSVRADAITCLECGHKGKMLKRHLMIAHGIEVDAYRSKWGLAADYPVVAPDYAARRSELAKSIGFGHRRTARA